MKALYIIIIFLSALPALGQTGKIDGTVSIEGTEPAPQVNVLVVETGSGTTTDENGNFSIHLEPGTYTLRVSRVGYITADIKVEVRESSTHSVSVLLVEDSMELKEVVISGSRRLNEQSLTIGKAGIKPFDLPQSITVIDSKILEQQQTMRVSDVLKNVNGVYTMGTTGGTQEEIAGRGFAFGSNNTFKNGVRFNNGAMPEVSGLESVEILKGSNAILFGSVAAGGVMNIVTKKPKFEEGGEVTFRAGSYNLYKPSVDVYGRVNDSQNVAFHINTTYEKAGSFRDDVESERFYINPSLLIRIGKKTTLLMEGDYLHDIRTPDYGIGAINYAVSGVPRNTFLGASWSEFESAQKSATVTATRQLGVKWQLKMIGSIQNFQSDLFGTSRPSTVKADGTWSRNLLRSGTQEQYIIAQSDLSGQFTTGRISHNVLVGFDIDRYDTEGTGYSVFGLREFPDSISAVYDKINVFDFNQFEQRTDIPRVKPVTLTRSPISRAGVYIQDLVSITKKLKLLAGIRYTYVETASQAYTFKSDLPVLNAIQSPKRYDDAFTPRIGVVYQPRTSMSLFASYANSFALNTGRDINYQPLKPSLMNQYELGIKNDFFDGLLSANVTIYQIVNSNQSQAVFPVATSPLNPSAQELAGEVTSRGIELDVMTRSWNGFTFIAGYSHNDTRYTESNIYIVGSRLRYNPANTANFSTHYAFGSNSILKGLSAGMTLFYVDKMVAGRSTRLTVKDDTYKLIPLPSFLQADATVGYTLSNVSFRIRVTNVGNVLSYYAHDDNSINPIGPRQFLTTLAYKF